MSLTEKLAGFIVETDFDDLPNEVVKKTKLCLLDFLGCVYGGSRDRSGRILLDLVRKIDGKREASVIAVGDKLPCTYAALVNGTMGHALEFDDLHTKGGAHPGVTIIPAALALAERERSSGEELITSIVIGYEVNVRVGLPVSFASEHKLERAHGVHVSSLMGTFGAAAAAAKLLKLDKERVANALRICALSPVSPFEATVGGGMVKDMYGGWPAHTGLFAALLAKLGFTGPDKVLEGIPLGIYNIVLRRDFDHQQLLDGLKDEWAILSTTFKPYACCRFSHSTIDALLKIILRTPIDPKEVKEITIRSHARAYHIGAITEPKDLVAARFSLPFIVARVIMKRGGVDVDDITEDTIKEKEALELAKKVRCIHDSYLDELALQGYRVANVKIALEDGRTYEGRVDIAKGDPRRPMSEEELIGKFKRLASMLIDQHQVEQVIHKTLSLETIKDIRGYVRGLLPKHKIK